jgi:predicted transposase/invertase (TIGR01784 family)
MSEWNLEDALIVEREEGREEALAEGIEKGRFEVAKNAIAKGASIEFVQEITGLDIETIKNLAAR